MPRRKSVFAQQDVTRALRAAQAAGLEIASYEIEPETGKIVVRIATATPPAPSGAPAAAPGSPEGALAEWLTRKPR